VRKLGMAGVVLVLARAAAACDICAVYTAMEAKEARPGLFAGMFEQWSDFGTLRAEGRRIKNAAGEDLRSSITQVYAGYQFNRRWGAQINAPYIDRSFRRAAADGIERGSESGLGDVVVTGSARLYERLTETSLVTWSVTAGLKLPTGDSGPLGEEAGEEHDEPGVESGIHGHDLARGSGSVDELVGSAVAWRHRRWFGAAAAQYAFRQRGDFAYRHADEITWETQLGRYVLLRHEDTLSVALRLAGETKGEDDVGGERAHDTSIDAVYAGPQVAFSRSRTLYAEAAIELPLRQDNSGLQLVPDRRLRAGLTWRF
jgi:hypothetical protein